jgi:hypothetical protein
MDRTRISRFLRIAATALCLTACVLLVALWVRSYYYLDSFGGPPRSLFTSWRGRLFAGGSIYQSSLSDGKDASDPELCAVLGVFIITTIDQNNLSYDGGNNLPIGALVFLLGILAVAPWLRWRFSLRTLLIATALISLGLGIIVAAM